MSELAFVVFVSKDYEQYLPFYILFNNLAYGEHKWNTIAYLEEGWEKRIGAELHSLTLANCYYEIRKVPYKVKVKPQIFKYYRWVINDNLYNDYDYLYFGDVDIFHVKEKPDLLKYHWEHSKAINLPYSNYTRKGTHRLSGLHFVKSAEYYPWIKLVQSGWEQDLLEHPRLIMKHRNEVMLYNMVGSSGMPLAPYDPLYEMNRHHGFHMRVFIPKNYARAKEYYRTESGKYAVEFISVINNSKLFWDLFGNPEFKAVRHQLVMLFDILGYEPKI